MKWRMWQRTSTDVLNQKLRVLPGALVVALGFVVLGASTITEIKQSTKVKTPTTMEANKLQSSALKPNATIMKPTPTSPNTKTHAQPSEFGSLSSSEMLEKRRMWFLSTPVDEDSARSLADDAAATLRKIASDGERALAVMEPTKSDGGVVNLSAYRRGDYDSSISQFFDSLKSKGITEKNIGMWMYLPEFNMPEWGQTDPDIFVDCVARTTRIQKARFPGSLTTVMLNSQTYPSDDTSYSRGSYKSLQPYVKSMPKGMIDSFGYQGFPWVQPANQPGFSNINPTEFLRSDLAIEAAQALGVQTIWLNTGSYSRMHTNDAAKIVTASSAERATVLSGIEAQARAIKAAGMGVAINMFLEDKSTTSEATDWSFGNHQQLLSDFIVRLGAAQIGLWRFD